MKTKIPVIMSINIEPEDRDVDRNLRAPWKGYEDTFEFFSQLRPRVAAVTGSPAHFSWFIRMDPQVQEAYGSVDWMVRHYSKSVGELKANGDELGLHPHAYRWDPGNQTWIVDHGNQPWVEHCVRLAFAAYEESLQQQCLSFQFGDRYMNNETSELIERLGARFDLTVEPGQVTEPTLDVSMPYTGFLPCYFTVPQVPYQPSKADFRVPGVPGERGLWVIPQSAGNVEGKLTAGRRVLSRLVRSALAMPPASKPMYRTLNLRTVPARTTCRIIERLLRTLETPYLSLVVRSSISQDPNGMRNMIEILEYLFSHRLAERFAFSTPGEALALLGYVQESEEQPSPRTSGRSSNDVPVSSLEGVTA